MTAINTVSALATKKLTRSAATARIFLNRCRANCAHSVVIRPGICADADDTILSWRKGPTGIIFLFLLVVVCCYFSVGSRKVKVEPDVVGVDLEKGMDDEFRDLNTPNERSSTGQIVKRNSVLALFS